MADTESTAPAKARDADDRHRRIRARFKACVDADGELRRKAREDFKFAWIAGSQWDTHFGTLRGDRPKYEFNKLRQAIKQVINDNRQNTPAIKVRATEDGDRDLAEVRQGLIRNIEAQSQADEAYDWGALYAITCGMGHWRIVAEHVDDDGFDLDLRIRRIHNPFAVWWDPAARELDRSDARYAFVEDSIPRDDFKDRWPDAECVDFDRADGLDDWFGQGTVRVAEYWEKTTERREILQLSDGRVVAADDWDEEAGNALPAPVSVVNRRTVDAIKLTMELVSGKETLEGPFEWVDNQIPIIPVWGDVVHVDGKDEWYGMVRHARDAQVLYNFERSNFAEVIATQPHAPFLYTAKHIEGYEREWSNLATENAPGLPVNIDPDFPGGLPKREMPPQMSPGYMAALQLSSDDLKAVTGIYDASLGARSNETSGRAIMARNREADVANFDYSDNIARAVRRTGDLLNRLIPKVYNSERTIRILGEDGGEKYARINHMVLDPMENQWRVATGQVLDANGKPMPVYDMTQGKFDVTIAAGPSYTTQRMETLDAMMQLAQSGGPLQPLAMYGVLKNMDAPGMDEVLAGFRKGLVQQGMLQPGEDDQPPQPPQPNPKDVADAEHKGAQARLAAAKAAQIEQDTERQVAMDAMQLGIAGPPGMPPPMNPAEAPQGAFLMPEIGAGGQPDTAF